MTLSKYLLPEGDKKSMTASNGLVSVIIPCFNQAQFLGEAIQSVLLQTYPHFEVIVVDDGSTDNTQEIAALYPEVHTIRQEHAGTSSARNRGLRESRGRWLVFLDSDDRLLPHALSAGLKHLLDHAECAFVFGHRREIAVDGTVLSTNPFVGIEKDPYRQLLLTCSVYPPSLAMFRRDLFETVAGFDPLIVGAEDYELYLRIARKFPIFGYEEIVAEYRRHDTNMTRDNVQMLKACLAVMRKQRPNVLGNKEWEEAYRTGMKNWRRYWCEMLMSQLWSRFKEGREWKGALREMMMLMRYGPDVVPRYLARKLSRPIIAARNRNGLGGLDLR